MLPQLNLVPRAHVSFGQRQDKELWNNQQSLSLARAHVSFAFRIYTAVLSKPNSTFLTFPVRIECLCETYSYRLYLWTPCKPRYVCAVKPELLKSWSLEELRVLALPKRHVGCGNEIGLSHLVIHPFCFSFRSRLCCVNCWTLPKRKVVHPEQSI